MGSGRGSETRSSLNVPRVQGLLLELLSEYGIPSAQVGILSRGEIIDFAVGIKDVETGQPATVDTVYQCGSMTKTWTALTFMQLVDEGSVDLDEPVRSYLPGFRVADPDVSARLTARHLLNHTNGIEEDYGDPGEDDDVYQRMVENIADAPQVFPLGCTHGYSAALGYAILARIIEVIDGGRWDEIMERRLFYPLGLNATSSSSERVNGDQAATGHLIRSLEEGPFITPVACLPRAFGAGGGINSTVRDVLTMAHVFLAAGRAPNGTRILSAASIDEMMQSRIPIPDPYMFGPWWALGLIVCDWHGETVFASDGSTIGQNARLRILPESNLAIAMLTNGGPRESFYKLVFNEILAGLGAVAIPDLPKPTPSLELDMSRYEGVYERPGTRFEVASEGEKLLLTSFVDPMQAAILGKPERITYEMLPINETHFLVPAIDPLEDPQTVAMYDFERTGARYLHTNSRVHPRACS